MNLKYNYNDLMISAATNPDTNELAYAVFVRKEDLNWCKYYVAENNEESGLEEVKEFIKAWHPESKVRFGGYEISAANL